jgi:peptidyl-prolyl cis-trans isomerase A (cyclophilin A)
VEVGREAAAIEIEIATDTHGTGTAAAAAALKESRKKMLLGLGILTLVASLAGAAAVPFVLVATRDSSGQSDLGTQLILLGASASPADYLLKLQTDVPVSGGTIVVNITESWAPLGAAHLKEVVADGFFTGAAFFRVVPEFIVQFGIGATPAMNTQWSEPIADDPVAASNLAGTITYAAAGPNTRTTQLFINLKDNRWLDAQGFAPFGRVVQGLDVLQAVYNPTPGSTGGVDQGAYRANGDSWIRANYPDINSISQATVTEL